MLSRPTVARWYLALCELRRKSWSVQTAVFDGIALGLFDRPLLHAIDELKYDAAARYFEEDYNRSGLTLWELQALERSFPRHGRLLLLAAGAGRELLALTRLGYEVDASEPHPGLVRRANELLAADGSTARVQAAPRDALPEDAIGPYDGLIIGWGAFSLIQGRDRRIALLRALRDRARPGAPLLLSFLCRPRGSRRFKLTATIGNALRRVRIRAEPVELGDGLSYEFMHHFTREEIEQDLRSAGFEPVFYSPRPYGHAVGTASA
jgi:hypothetical protein